MKSQQLPFFVYGSLRNGLGNYYGQFYGLTDKEIPATMQGLMYSLKDFPAVTLGEGKVVGELMYVNPLIYNEVLASVDMLEGYMPGFNYCLYDRQKVIVDTDTDKVLAWTYVWTHHTDDLEYINHGDWIKHITKKRR